jgi:hypothetical protein
MQAVTRVKLEQASKVVMWTPTRPRTVKKFVEYDARCNVDAVPK